MLTLYLVRHAKSDWANGHISDIDRPLNERGYRDATAMSTLLKAQNIHPQLIISSPAVRALSTALIFSRNLNYDPNKINIQKKLYNTDADHYLSVLEENAGNAHSVMLFGHNPVITSVANKLCKTFTNEMPTCSIVGIKFQTASWEEISQDSAELILYDSPKNHSH